LTAAVKENLFALRRRAGPLRQVGGAMRENGVGTGFFLGDNQGLNRILRAAAVYAIFI